MTDVEEAASKAHVDPHALDRARADLGIVASRANTGHFRFWANRTSSRHGLRTESDPNPVIDTIRRTGFMERGTETAGSICLDARELHHLAPLFGFLGNEPPKVGG